MGKVILFLPLLMIDSGVYYNHSGKEIYGFNMESCDNIILHLLELIPEVFFEYQREPTLLAKENGLNYKGYGIIFINKNLIANENMKLDLEKDEYKDIKTKRLFKHCAIKASKTIFHETFCHNKTLFNNNSIISSPKRFYNKDKKLVKIVPYNYRKVKNKKNVEYYKAIKNINAGGESGKFLEYFFGKYNEELIIDLIYKIDYIGNLFDYIDYFVKEDIELLKKYIINLSSFSLNNSNFSE